jgi:hypothetical protein
MRANAKRSIASFRAAVLDPYASSVVLDLRFNGEHNSTTDVDSSSYARTVSVFGGAKISKDQWVEGGSSCVFDGTNSYLTCPYSTDLDFPGDFTLEFWLCPSTVTGNQGLLVKRNMATTGVGSWGLQLEGAGPRFTNLNTISSFLCGVVTANAQNHVAVSRIGSTIRGYTNGKFFASMSDSTNFNYNNSLYIGVWGYAASPPAAPNTLTQFLGGFKDRLRITKGVGRYLADFAPPI